MRVYGILIALTAVLIFAAVKTGFFQSDKHVASDQTASDTVSVEEADCCAGQDNSCCQEKACCDQAKVKECGEDGCEGDCCSADTASSSNKSCCAGSTSKVMALVAAANNAAASNNAQPQESKKKDWRMWGGTLSRNMTADVSGVNLEFDLESGKNVAWTRGLGSQTYGNAIVADGKVFVGTNNGAKYRPNHEGDRGCLLCFDEKSGEFLWQLTREKLAAGRVNDWPYQGICSTPFVELAENEEGTSRMWVVTNRCELMCLDVNGFHDDNNNGPYKDEVDSEKQDADIIWSLDMIDELGVFPHNLATSSPIVHGDMVYLLTSNGVDEAHLELPSPRSPSFIAVNKNTGEVVWEDNTPLDKVLHGQWSSPAIGVINGRTQVYFPGGDGWLYALDGKTGKHIWKFDLNPKESQWELGGAGTRNAVIATPVVYENSVIIAVGQDPEHGEGVGHLWRIDATKADGRSEEADVLDISSELGEIGERGRPNPNSGVIWHYGGVDEDGSVTGKRGRTIYRRTMSTVAIGGGLVFAADMSGFLHCVDFKTGKRYWEHDMFSGIWGSPMLADGKVFLGVEDGKLIVFEATKEKPVVIKEYDTNNYSSIYSTPTFANGRMYLTDRTRLYAVEVDK